MKKRRIEWRPTGLSLDFLREEFAPVFRNCVDAFFVLLVLFLGASLLFPKAASDYVTQLSAYFSDSGLLNAGSRWEEFALIFENNVQATILTVVYGFLPFLFYPALTLGTNALILSALGVVSVGGGSVSLAAYLAGILPHGVFEIPALLLSCAVGLCHCRLVTGLILKRPAATSWRQQVISLSYVYVALVLPLLLVAALIETFLTPAAIAWFL